jgi:hypothetical protein
VALHVKWDFGGTACEVGLRSRRVGLFRSGRGRRIFVLLSVWERDAHLYGASLISGLGWTRARLVEWARLHTIKVFGWAFGRDDGEN